MALGFTIFINSHSVLLRTRAAVIGKIRFYEKGCGGGSTSMSAGEGKSCQYKILGGGADYINFYLNMKLGTNPSIQTYIPK